MLPSHLVLVQNSQSKAGLLSSGIAMQTDELLVDRIGCVTVLTLNRPRQLNVLSLSMVRKLQEVYARSDADPEIKAIVVRGAGERQHRPQLSLHLTEKMRAAHVRHESYGALGHR